MCCCENPFFRGGEILPRKICLTVIMTGRHAKPNNSSLQLSFSRPVWDPHTVSWSSSTKKSLAGASYGETWFRFATELAAALTRSTSWSFTNPWGGYYFMRLPPSTRSRVKCIYLQSHCQLQKKKQFFRSLLVLRLEMMQQMQSWASKVCWL